MVSGSCLYLIYSFAGIYIYAPTASLQRGGSPPATVLDVTPSNLMGEVPVVLELGEMRNAPSLLPLQGPLWLGVVAPDGVLLVGQVELNCVLILNWTVWNRAV